VDNYFDMVYSAYVIQHISDAEKVIKEIYRVLKPKGTFIFKSSAVFLLSKKRFFIPTIILRKIKQLYGGYLLCPYFKFYNKKSMRNILENNGFKIKKIYYSLENCGSLISISEKIK